MAKYNKVCRVCNTSAVNNSCPKCGHGCNIINITAKKMLKDVVIDADHILYDVASEPSKGFVNSLGGKSIKVRDGKAELKKLKKAFMARVDEYTKIAEVESIAYKWKLGETMIFISDKSNFRYDIYPEYKANRKGRVHTEGFLKLRKWARKKFAPKQNIEADDIVAHYVRKGAIGFTTDKDLLKGVAGLWFDCYHTRRHWTNPSEEDAVKFNFQQYIAGDLTDGIKGIEGIGLIKAQGLLDKFGWDWGGVVQAYESKGLTVEDAVLTRRLVSMNQWSPKKGLKLFGEIK